MVTNPTQTPVFFFDCDNCLYHHNTGISTMMQERIIDYIKRLGFTEEQAKERRNKYNKLYGLTLRGLINDFGVDPLEFDRKVDGSLPLDQVLKPDLALQSMLQRMKIRKWVFTNAYYLHAERCLKLLGIDNEFEGMTYVDYGIANFDCKPEPSAYKRAMKEAGISDPSICYLVDDSAANVDMAKELGWTAIHVTDDPSRSNHGHYQIATIYDLPSVLPHLWQ